MTSDDSDWKSANSWIEGNIRMSLESGGYTHISRITGAYKSKGYTSREVLWRTISRANLDDYKSITEYVKAIEQVKTKLAELGHTYIWEITTSFLHGLPSSYESFMEIILNSRDKDSNGKLLESDFDNVVEQLINRERRQKLMSSDDNSKAPLARNNNNNNNNKNNNNKAPCSEFDNVHEKICFFKQQDQAPGWWLERNKDRLEEYNKKNKNERPKLQKSC